ncbi:TPA: SEC-C metal-binding domain-containing protein [Pseudomonas aeruginosa]|nr:SEC-C domain-containing protein [Pseudomonas aeruginosa]
MFESLRNEAEIFESLRSLCASKGYIHAIAYFCFRDNTIKFSGDIKVADILEQFSMDRLVRTEISTLIGLMCKAPINFDHPGAELLQEYIDETEDLLKELHGAMLQSAKSIFDPSKIGDPSFNPFQNGNILRESIFYGGESAYNFQYQDLSLKKYKGDGDWFIKNKGYSVEQASVLISGIGELQDRKINETFDHFRNTDPETWSFMPAFTFSAEELSDFSGIDVQTVVKFVESFSHKGPLEEGQFLSLGDYNPLNAYPIINLGEDRYLLFQVYSLVEALYETPFFWFISDSEYKVKARENRGAFAESFCYERLRLIFGKHRVFTNIDVYDGKKRVGEIDVLAIFSNRAIVLQAKSKKLTIEARKGNDLALRDDFKKAVQDAYDQALECSGFLLDEKFKLIDSNGNEIKINRQLKEVYPFCVVSDHYPALSFQARQFLRYETTETIRPPFVTDVFFIDVLTEIFPSPLHLLSYINKRALYADRILSTHELTILSYHLTQNLWLENETSLLHLADDVCAALDLAMLTRRTGAPGIATPEGILTKFNGTTFGSFISEIDQFEDPAVIDLGFLLLSLSEETINQLNEGTDKLCELSLIDGKSHDLTLGISAGNTGLTIHCNNTPAAEAQRSLQNHCYKRKYLQKARSWFGLCINPGDKKIRFGLELDFEWHQSDEMDRLTVSAAKGQPLRPGQKINISTNMSRGRKVGRNEECPCGSGRKYKKCCL